MLVLDLNLMWSFFSFFFILYFCPKELELINRLRDLYNSCCKAALFTVIFAGTVDSNSAFFAGIRRPEPLLPPEDVEAAGEVSVKADVLPDAC
jgi:hypothetical protein